MEFREHKFSGVYSFKPDYHYDERGCFLESYNTANYEQYLPKIEFLQDNISVSKFGCLRGLHAQRREPQAKLLTLIKGKILDVIVDLNPNSKYFGAYDSSILEFGGFNQLFIPQGFAHGFVALSDEVILHYKVNRYFAPDDQVGIIWNDPKLNIDWGMDSPILSEKDSKNISFDSFMAELSN